MFNPFSHSNQSTEMSVTHKDKATLSTQATLSSLLSGYAFCTGNYDTFQSNSQALKSVKLCMTDHENKHREKKKQEKKTKQTKTELTNVDDLKEKIFIHVWMQACR